jgi:hypothetical protein
MIHCGRKSLIDGILKVCKITINNDGLTARRRTLMGDKGGKKDKEKEQKQNTEKQKQKSKNKLDKQPQRKP